MVTISVLMPVFNGERYLREAINSILSQSFGDFEFIIINDGSTDASEEIILSYTDKRIVYVKNEVNLRLIKTLNKGIDIAQGKYIARMDADDVALPNRFEVQMNYFNQYSDVSIVNGNSMYLYHSKKIKKNKMFFPWKGETLPYIQPLENTIFHPSVMVFSEILKENKYRDDKTAVHIEDWELWLRLLDKKIKFITTDSPVLLYRITEGSINRLYKNEQIDNMFHISSSYLSKNLGFNMEHEILRYILGDKKIIIQLKDILPILKAYLCHLEEKVKIKTDIVSELEYWIYLFCLRDLKYKFKNDRSYFLKDFLFFMKHVNHKNGLSFLVKKSK